MTTDAEKLLSNAIRLRDSGRLDMNPWLQAVEYVRLGLEAAKEEGAREALTFARDRMYGKNAAPVTPRLEDWLSCFAEWSSKRGAR
jgi:hypothetical protein